MTANQLKIRAFNSAWNRGRGDFEKGQNENPYVEDKYLRQAWAEGFYWAELAFEASPLGA